jgi:hypothetical protein
MDPATARRYRSAVLEAGGSKPAAELVKDFLGRPSGFEAWTRWIEREAPTASGTPAASGAQVGG